MENASAPFDLQALVRPNIRSLHPYSSARDEFTGQAEIYLDANENPFDSGFNRYPDPLARQVKALLAREKGVTPEQIALGNGSDEIIDLIYRIFCRPGVDQVITLPPTYGMYRVSADINDVAVKEVPLLPGFQPDTEAILAAVDERTKVLWLCSPNNPSANDLEPDKVRALLAGFPGIVVIDEAYVDFTGRDSYATLLADHPNLIVMQTFSKAWGLAGIRLGMALASREIISLFNRVKPPYNVNELTQRKALEALQQSERMRQEVATIIGQRTLLQQYLAGLDFVERIYPSDSNFLLVKVNDPRGVYGYLVERGVIVRDRSKQYLCEGCLRFTVGTPEENETLFRTLLEMQ
ncbi:MAG: histidinol-phosphate transaminase [Lewinella sp.]|nr:histidinol-phosphate transaminase [Lewinella sp.]